MVDLQPTLRGTLVTLRPLRADDWDALFAVASDPLIWQQHPDSDRYQEPVFREFFRIALETGSAFTVLDSVTGEVIGSTRYFGYDAAKREVEIGWTFLARSHWGGPHNGEMKSLMIAHARAFADSVIFVIGPQNQRSRRAVEKIGGVFESEGMERGRPRVIYRVPTAPR